MAPAGLDKTKAKTKDTALPASLPARKFVVRANVFAAEEKMAEQRLDELDRVLNTKLKMKIVRKFIDNA